MLLSNASRGTSLERSKAHRVIQSLAEDVDELKAALSYFT